MAEKVVPSNLDKSNEERIDTKLVNSECKEYVKDIICLICLNIAFYPYTCGSCKGIYCRNCIERWMESNENCPKCRAQGNFSELDRSIDLFEKVKIKCGNSSRGCSEILQYSCIEDHLHNCEYAIYFCLGKGCTFSSKKKEFFEHMETCELFLKNYSLVADQKERCVSDLFINCNTCGKAFIFKDHEYHLKKCEEPKEKEVVENIAEFSAMTKKKLYILIGCTSVYNSLVIVYFVDFFIESKKLCNVFDDDIIITGFLKILWILIFVPLISENFRKNNNLIRKTKIAFFTFFIIDTVFCLMSTINFSSLISTMKNKDNCSNFKIAFLGFLSVEWFFIIVLSILTCITNKPQPPVEEENPN